MNNRLGMLQVYTGDGKGKTTASLGLALRAIGHGFKVLMIQFLKGDRQYGEVLAAPKLPGFFIKQTGRDSFVNFADPDPVDLKMVREGWEIAKRDILGKQYDMVILDEINVVLGTGLLPVEEVTAFLRDGSWRPVEIVMTGRLVPPAIVELADLVTEMKELKHYFVRGISSRDGIDH
jgi:cob(I)alamin adenosyltransferase